MRVYDDFVRYLALRLFNTAYGADLFNNQTAMTTNIYNLCATVASTIVTHLVNIDTTHATYTDSNSLHYLTNDASGTNNITRELVSQIAKLHPERFATIDATEGRQNVPLITGDSLNFNIIINPATNQHLLTSVAAIPAHSYRIKLVIDPDFVSKNNYTLVAGAFQKLTITPSSSLNSVGMCISYDGNYTYKTDIGHAILYRSTNDGTTTALTIPTIAGIICCNSTGSRVYYFEWDGARGFVSTDYGVTWTVTGGSPSNDAFAACNSTGQYIFTSGGQLISRSADYGAVWTQIDGTANAVVNCSSDGLVIIGKSNYTVGISTDYGLNFVYTATGNSTPLRSVAISKNSGVVYCFVGQDGMVSSGIVNVSTGVITWTHQQAFTSHLITSIACSDNGQAVAFGHRQGSMQTSTDYGNTWVPSALNSGSQFRCTSMTKDGSLTRISLQISDNGLDVSKLYLFDSRSTYITIP